MRPGRLPIPDVRYVFLTRRGIAAWCSVRRSRDKMRNGWRYALSRMMIHSVIHVTSSAEPSAILGVWGGNIIWLLKAKFHYASLFGAGSEPASNQLAWWNLAFTTYAIVDVCHQSRHHCWSSAARTSPPSVIEPSDSFTCWPYIRSPLPSSRHRRSNGDCLESKREHYQVCSVQYCVQQLCTVTVQCTHIWTDLTVLWIGFCLTGPISLQLDSFLCMYCMHV